MFSTDDTIVAIATPPGRGGIGVVRISGPDAQSIATSDHRPRPLSRRGTRRSRAPAPSPCATRHRHVLPRARVVHRRGRRRDQRAREPGHLAARSCAAAIDAGARLAEPGEFTLRAYLHGRIDLVQAEAVKDLIDAVTPLQARAAFDQLDGTLTTRIREIDGALFDLSARLEASLDFPEEGYHFVEPGRVASEIGGVMRSHRRAARAGARAAGWCAKARRVAILGRPNAGKSTLFNALAGAHRAIVTDIPGTTRDLVTEVVDSTAFPSRSSTPPAFASHAADAVETEGIARARSAASVADLLLVVLDRSRPLDDEDHALLQETVAPPRVVVASKCDLA